jgi:hypothetical protein
MGELTITANDPLSGISYIEYRIGDNGIQQYREPLLFVEEGGYRVNYRAADKAGNIGPWQSCDLWVTPNHSGITMMESVEINGMPRVVMYHARNGMPIIEVGKERDTSAFLRSNPEAMINLPSYTLGAEYILWEEDDSLLDESARIRFRVKRDAVVYLFLPQNTAAPRGWGFVEARTELNRRYYPGGATVYMRRYDRSDLVEISGTPGALVQPLILVQERGGFSAEILIHREEEADVFTLDALVSPWQFSRRLPLRKRWLVNAGDGWAPLDGNRYDASAAAPVTSGDTSGFLRFRLELVTPDGVVEYRTEKVLDTEEFYEEDNSMKQ